MYNNEPVPVTCPSCRSAQMLRKGVWSVPGAVASLLQCPSCRNIELKVMDSSGELHDWDTPNSDPPSMTGSIRGPLKPI